MVYFGCLRGFWVLKCKILCALSRNAGNTNFVLAFCTLIPYDDSIDMAMSDAADGFVSKGQGKLNMG